MADAQAAAPEKKAKKPSPFKKLAQFQTPDGKIFGTQAEATKHLRRHLVEAEVAKITQGNKELTEWIMNNKDALDKAFDAANPPPRQISPETRAKMRVALEQRLGKMAGKK